MPVENEPALVRFDAEAAVPVAWERAGGDLLVAGEYADEGFNLVYFVDEGLYLTFQPGTGVSGIIGAVADVVRDSA